MLHVSEDQCPGDDRWAMERVKLQDCVGLWQRTLYVDADGVRDENGNVRWLQGVNAFVDSRGFAGRTDQHGDCFTWTRLIGRQVSGSLPDIGRMRWDGATLVEVGVAKEYTEHWTRDDGAASSPSGALFLRRGEADAVLLRVEDQFGWANGADVLIGTVGGDEWNSLHPRPYDGGLKIDSGRWAIVGRECDGEVDWDLWAAAGPAVSRTAGQVAPDL